MFTAAASNATAFSTSNSMSSNDTQDNEFLFSALGASPLRQDPIENSRANSHSDSNPNRASIFQAKDGALIDPVTPKANALLFHYLRRASLANHQQAFNESPNEALQEYQHSSTPLSDRSDSSTMSPPSISITPSSSMAPPSLTFLSEESSMIAQDGATAQGHSILMDFSPRIRKSVGNASAFSSPTRDQSFVGSQKTPTTPVNKIAEADPMLTLSMERLSVRQSMDGDLSPKILKFSVANSNEVEDIISHTGSNDADQNQDSHEDSDEDAATTNLNEDPSDFSLDRFPIVFQVSCLNFNA